jgi:hypothetical protein
MEKKPYLENYQHLTFDSLDISSLFLVLVIQPTKLSDLSLKNKLNLYFKTPTKSKLINKQFKNLHQSIRICAVFTEGLKFNLNLLNLVS